MNGEPAQTGKKKIVIIIIRPEGPEFVGENTRNLDFLGKDQINILL